MDGEIIGVIGFSIEITERKNAENALIESEQKFRLLFDTSPEGVLLATLDGKIISTNQAFQNIIGYTAEELPQLSFSDIVG
jgi:PAS domain-containing protein